jgi:transposase
MPAPRKYDEETRQRAVRMYEERRAEGGVSQVAARKEVGELLGINADTLRNWIRSQAETAGGGGGGGERRESLEEENRRLRAENARLQRANEILKTSSAFFAAAELDRKLGR